MLHLPAFSIDEAQTAEDKWPFRTSFLAKLAVEKLPDLFDELSFPAREVMIRARDFDLGRAFQCAQYRFARARFLQHGREIALAVNVEYRQSQFTGIREL